MECFNCKRTLPRKVVKFRGELREKTCPWCVKKRSSHESLRPQKPKKK